MRDECVPSSDGDAAGAASGGGANPDASTSSGGATGAGGAGSEGSPARCDDGATLTREEWAACTAPILGPYRIETIGCADTLLPQGYEVLPPVSCRVAPEYSQQSPLRLCGVLPFCTHHDDCTDEVPGRCVGSADNFCEYRALTARPCTRDADCSSVAPGATCPAVFLTDRLCYPSGDCETATQTCFIRQDPCEGDSDCTAAEGGICKKLITNVRCEYPDCIEDTDCGPSQRCACHRCVPSTCNGDLDCGDGSTCLLGDGCFGANGYHCTSPADTCQTQSDCPGGPREYREGHWQCGGECPQVP